MQIISNLLFTASADGNLKICNFTNGIVYKDVRPQNFIVIKEANWDVKLMDFGSVNTYTKDNSGRLNVNF